LSKAWNSTIDGAKTNLEKLKIIAQQFLVSAKNLPKTVITEAISFFSVYKEQIEDLWKEIEAVGNNNNNNNKTA
jgi:uncharacterized ferredoxin-like protein